MVESLLNALKNPRDVRELRDAGFVEIAGGGKGSHRKFVHENYQGVVTLSGKDGDDAKKYQEKHVKLAVEEAAE